MSFTYCVFIVHRKYQVMPQLSEISDLKIWNNKSKYKGAITINKKIYEKVRKKKNQ